MDSLPCSVSQDDYNPTYQCTRFAVTITIIITMSTSSPLCSQHRLFEILHRTVCLFLFYSFASNMLSHPPDLIHAREGALNSLLTSPISTNFFLGVPLSAAILLALPLLCRICSSASSLLIPPGVAGAGLKYSSLLSGTVIVVVWLIVRGGGIGRGRGVRGKMKEDV